MPFCTQCGADVSGNKFCSKCGAPVADQGTGGAASQSEGEFAQQSGTATAAQPAAEASPASGSDAGSMSASSQNIAAALSYVTPIAVVLLLLEPFKDIRFVRFHSLQSLFYFGATLVVQIGLWIGGGVLGLIGIGAIMAPIGYLIGIGIIIGWLVAVFKAYQGQMFYLPVVGELAARQV